MGDKIDSLITGLVVVLSVIVVGFFIWSYFYQPAVEPMPISFTNSQTKGMMTANKTPEIRITSPYTNGQTNMTTTTKTTEANSVPQRIIPLNEEALVLDVSYKGDAITSQYEKDVLNYLDFLKFPRDLRKGMIIFIIPPDFIEQKVLVKNRNLKLEIKQPNDAYTGHWCDGRDCFAVIVIKSSFFSSDFYGPLTHELGHNIAIELTETDWQQWKKLRGDPMPLGLFILINPNRIDHEDWINSPTEDFAEVYKVAFGNHKGGSPDTWGNKTAYGIKACHYTEEQFIKDPNLYSKFFYTQVPCYEDIPPDKETINFIKKILARYK